MKRFKTLFTLAGSAYTRTKAVLGRFRLGRLFARSFEQPQMRKQGAPAPMQHGAAPRPDASTPQHATSPLDGVEWIGHDVAIREIDPQTGRVLDQVEEHRTVGNQLVTQVTNVRVLGAEGAVGDAQRVQGKCGKCGKFAFRIFHCAVPDCGISVCAIDSVPLDPNSPNTESVRVCRSCGQVLAFRQNTWQAFDEGRSI